jgi:hypothetical protein
MDEDPEFLRERAKRIRRVADDPRGRRHFYLVSLAEHYEERADVVELARAGNKPQSTGARRR